MVAGADVHGKICLELVLLVLCDDVLPRELKFLRWAVSRVLVQHRLQMGRSRDDRCILNARRIRPLCLGRGSDALANADAPNVNNDATFTSLLAAVAIRRRKLHHDCADPLVATGDMTREPAKVPPPRDEIGSHPLDGMYEHAKPGKLFDTTCGTGCSPSRAIRDMTRDLCLRPEAMYNVSVSVVNVRAKVRKAAFGQASDLDARGMIGTRDKERDGDVIGHFCGDSVVFRVIWIRGRRAIDDTESVRLAGACVLSRRRRHKVTDATGSPDGLLGRRVVQFECELNGWIPEPDHGRRK